MLFPPLLMAPCDVFDGDPSLRKVAEASLRCKSDKNYDVLIAADDEGNTKFSVLAPPALHRVASALVPWAQRAKVIVIAFPHNAYACDAKGKPFPAPHTAKVVALPDEPPARLEYASCMWTPACEAIVETRLAHFKLAYKRCGVAVEAMDSLLVERDALKASLASELAQAEALRKRFDEAIKKREVKASKRLLADKDREQKALVELFARELCNMERASKASRDDDDLARAIQIARQCDHYFSHDRYSSLYFREQLQVGVDGKECVPISTIASFPRLKMLCEGNAQLIETACRALGHDVREERIVFND